MNAETHLTALRKRLKAARTGSKLRQLELVATIESVKIIAGIAL